MTNLSSRQSPRLSDAIALVTGATAYIGRAIALELARRGARVVVSGRNADAGRSVVAEIEAAGGHAEFAGADLADRMAVKALVEGIVSRHGRLDVLAASGAGASSDSLAFKLFMDMSGDDFDTYIRSHWLARAHVIQAAAAAMRAQGRGKIVAIGTDAGRVATVGESFIGGATGGMMQMCRVLARELGRDGIRINAVAMSYIADAEPRWGGASPALAGHERGMLQQLKKRMLFPVHCDDIARAVAFFAGPESDAITGQTLSVNGGLSTPG
ncbi:SDR family NAD(P)-dependent oxidoreductase [Ramlibacter albus]|uniref:SDR family oxidoreductase n=1 Tax=Ramlibacter albus TaxID=2079448 RepID=A0A923M2S4_9BURK|nr:SDR family oxidoreductase [Ramlibacter albus]MBC5762840.1 SDR family oxidoreductase [Ramlibacter albus]